MAHVNYSRQVDMRGRERLERIVPLDMGGCNFAAFGGTSEQRVAMAVRSAARYCGRCGIIVLVNEPSQGTADPLEEAMLGLPRSLPEELAQYRMTPASRICWEHYDLLYGLDEDSITELLFPGNDTPGHGGLVNPVLGGLQAYLQILSSEFQENPEDFGDYPFNMNLLLEITAMPYQQLERRVLRYLPGHIQATAQSFLSKADVQAHVHTVVRQFANRFKKFRLMPGPFLNHSRRSIFSAAAAGEIVCLRIPDSSPVLLDYIEAELAQLSAQGVQYLLMASDLNLTNNPNLQKRFLSQRTGSYYTGILSESLSAIADTEILQQQLFSTYQQILAFQFSVAGLAEPFSANLGIYKYLELHFSTGHTWQPFHIFSSVHHGTEKVLVDQRNIRPEELTENPNGALLCGKLYPVPILMRNLILPRRN